MADQRVARLSGCHQQIEHVIRLFAMRRHYGKLHLVSSRPGCQATGILMPDAAACRLDVLAILELRVQECGGYIGGEETRAYIDPRVFVDLTAKEATAIGALLANDLGAIDVGRIVQEKGAAFAAAEILGLVK